MIFRIIASLSLIVLLGIWIRMALKSSTDSGSLRISTLAIFKGPVKEGGFWPGMRRWFFQITVFLFIIQALSGFLPFLITGGSLSGLALLIHVTAAPLLALSLMAWIILSARRQAFSQQDFAYIQDRKNAGPEVGRKFRKKLYFWLGTALSVPAMLSMVFAMYPIFGMDGQQLLLELHRYTVLLMTILFLLYLIDEKHGVN